MSRLIAATWGLGVVLAAALPLLRNPLNDGFPLSTFPMFAEPLEKPTFYSAEGVLPDRSRVMVPAELIANGAAMQSVWTLQSAHAQGKQVLRQLCERIATQVPQHSKLREVQRVELVAARYDPIAYFVSGPAPLEREVLHKCKVRSAP
ncbi:MAG TPA: hypothetical protein VHP33_08530 [Polyangiaceae bacterium]|nr:hypothetical protein [Polyangiaceae bacterium]